MSFDVILIETYLSVHEPFDQNLNRPVFRLRSFFDVIVELVVKIVGKPDCHRDVLAVHHAFPLHVTRKLSCPFFPFS